MRLGLKNADQISRVKIEAFYFLEIKIMAWYKTNNNSEWNERYSMKLKSILIMIHKNIQFVQKMQIKNYLIFV